MARFIVIDGLDGCGKATQTAKLKESLEAMGKKVVTITFPNYDSGSSTAVKMYLNGEIGKDPSKLNPYMCGSFYAVDRFISYEQKYKEYFNESDDTIIISDRYLSANIIHQGGKLDNITERRNYAKWCYDFECGLCGMPIEDMTILLTIPPKASQKLLSNRYSGDETKKDIHEHNVKYLEDCYDRLGDTVKYLNEQDSINWCWIDCYDSNNDRVMTIDEIHKIILEKVIALINKS